MAFKGGWVIKHLDVCLALFYGNLIEEVYMS